MSSDRTHIYQITVQSECATLLATVFDPIEVQPCRAGRTCVVVPVRDESELWGLMNRLQDLALRIVSLYEVQPDGPDNGAGPDRLGEPAAQPPANSNAGRK